MSIEYIKDGSKTTIGPGDILYYTPKNGTKTQIKDVNFVKSGVTTKVYHYDSTSPEITISSWSQTSSSPSYVKDENATIKGTVSDTESGVKSLTVDGTSTSWDSSGNYSQSVKLSANSTKTITVSAADVAGNSSSKSCYIYRDTVGPSITLTASTTATEGTTATVRVQASDSASGVAWVKYGDTAKSTSDYTFTISLSEGSNSYTFYACDNVGNTTSSSVTIKRYPYRSASWSITTNYYGWFLYNPDVQGVYGRYRTKAASTTVSSNHRVTGLSSTTYSENVSSTSEHGQEATYTSGTGSISLSGYTRGATISLSELALSDCPTDTSAWNCLVKTEVTVSGTYYYYDYS